MTIFFSFPYSLAIYVFIEHLRWSCFGAFLGDSLPHAQDCFSNSLSTSLLYRSLETRSMRCVNYFNEVLKMVW